MVKCPVCEKSELMLEKKRSELYGFNLGEYMAEVCRAYGEIFWLEDDVAQMESRAKELGIWGLKHKDQSLNRWKLLDYKNPQKTRSIFGSE